jgi:hypothetical protein
MSAQQRSLENATIAGDELISTPIGDIELRHSFFDDDTSRMLFDEMDYQRACQAYIWSTPIVSTVAWRRRQNEAFGVKGATDFVVLESLKEKRGLITANLTTPYILHFGSLKDGPLVVEYPAGKTAGACIDLWQRPLVDMGLTGPDQGKGGTYVLVGPNDDPAAYAAPGVFVAHSATNTILLGLRVLDPDPAFYALVKSSLKMGRHGTTPATCRFIENVDVEWSATAPRGLEYWQVLAEAIRDEPVRAVDKAWMAMLLPLGIAPGQPFQPDARQQAILLKGAAMGELMTRNLQVNPRFAEPYWKDTSWYKSFDFTLPQETATRVELDERATWFYEAVTSTEGMVNPVVGKGQVYMTTKRDATGALLRADKTYKLHVPKDVPVGQFWSLTLYSEDTRRPYDNGGTEIASTSIDSRTKGLKYNADGSVDLFIGVKAPAGFESNFMKTVGQDGWFVYFRLYAPLQAFFDKTFSLADFEQID